MSNRYETQNIKGLVAEITSDDSTRRGMLLDLLQEEVISEGMQNLPADIIPLKKVSAVFAEQLAMRVSDPSTLHVLVKGEQRKGALEKLISNPNIATDDLWVAVERYGKKCDARTANALLKFTCDAISVLRDRVLKDVQDRKITWRQLADQMISKKSAVPEAVLRGMSLAEIQMLATCGADWQVNSSDGVDLWSTAIQPNVEINSTVKNIMEVFGIPVVGPTVSRDTALATDLELTPKKLGDVLSTVLSVYNQFSVADVLRFERFVDGWDGNVSTILRGGTTDELVISAEVWRFIAKRLELVESSASIPNGLKALALLASSTGLPEDVSLTERVHMARMLLACDDMELQVCGLNLFRGVSVDDAAALSSDDLDFAVIADELGANWVDRAVGGSTKHLPAELVARLSPDVQVLQYMEYDAEEMIGGIEQADEGQLPLSLELIEAIGAAMFNEEFLPALLIKHGIAVKVKVVHAYTGQAPEMFNGWQVVNPSLPTHLGYLRLGHLRDDWSADSRQSGSQHLHKAWHPLYQGVQSHPQGWEHPMAQQLLDLIMRGCSLDDLSAIGYASRDAAAGQPGTTIFHMLDRKLGSSKQAWDAFLKLLDRTNSVSETIQIVELVVGSEEMFDAVEDDLVEARQ